MTDQHLNEFPAEGRQPYQGHPYPAPPTPAKPKTRKGLAAVLTAGGLVVGLIIGGSIGSSGKGAPQEVTAAPVQASQAPAKGKAKEPAPEPEKPAQGYGDGTYEVGVDIEPGRYKVTVPADSYGCYFARLKDDSGDFDAILTNGNKEPEAKVSVTIKKGDGFFETSGCGEWVKQ